MNRMDIAEIIRVNNSASSQLKSRQSVSVTSNIKANVLHRPYDGSHNDGSHSINGDTETNRSNDSHEGFVGNTEKVRWVIVLGETMVTDPAGRVLVFSSRFVMISISLLSTFSFPFPICRFLCWFTFSIA